MPRTKNSRIHPEVKWRQRGARSARADVLVVVEDVVRVVRRLHIHQSIIDGVAIGLADSVGMLVAAQEVDVDAFAKAAERGEEFPRPGRVPLAAVLAGP